MVSIGQYLTVFAWGESNSWSKTSFVWESRLKAQSLTFFDALVLAKMRPSWDLFGFLGSGRIPG